MPVYKVTRKPHWTPDGPIPVGETVTLPEEQARLFKNNLQLVDAEAKAVEAKEAAKTVEEAEAKAAKGKGAK